MCILSPVLLVMSALIKDNDTSAASMTALLLVIVAFGVYMIVRVALVKSSYQILLQEEDYNKTEKKKNKAKEKASGIYWGLIDRLILIETITLFYGKKDILYERELQ